MFNNFYGQVSPEVFLNDDGSGLASSFNRVDHGIRARNYNFVLFGRDMDARFGHLRCRVLRRLKLFVTLKVGLRFAAVSRRRRYLYFAICLSFCVVEFLN